MKFICRILAALPALFVAGSALAQKYDGVIEKVVAVIGNEPIMLSELESEVKLMQAQTGLSGENSRCEVLEQMMSSKLFLMQSRIDSLNVNQEMVEAQISERLNRIRQMFGGDEGAERYFGKSLYKLRQEWHNQLEEMSLMQQEQQKIASGIGEISPHDVNVYLDTVDVSNLPVIPKKYRISQICIYPDRDSAAMAVKEKLIALRERIMAGERFSTMARLYSDDTETAKRGGEIGLAPAGMFWPQFADAAMSLKPGIISQIVETPDGFHIIQLIEKNKDMFNARHILIKPTYSDEDRREAFARLDSLRDKILDSTLTFELAARLYSQDPTSRTNGGLMSDPATGSAYFEVDKMKRQDYLAVSTLSEGEISKPLQSLDNEGRNGNTVYKIVRLDRIIPAHVATRENDYSELLDKVTQARQAEEIEKFVKEKIKDTYIRIDPLFGNCEFEDSGWLERARQNW